MSPAPTIPPSRRTCFALAVAACGFASTATAETRVQSVFADRQSHLLFIDGAEFTSGTPAATAAYVELDGQVLAIGANTTDTHIEATLPDPLPDGEYQVFVSRRVAAGTNPHGLAATRTANYSLTVQTPLSGATGATGARGPTGAAGTRGATGAAGIAGPAGSQGAVGPTGAIGATGASGTRGATGATGTAGADGKFINAYRGIFATGTSYARGDIAYDSAAGAGSSWICVAAAGCPPSAAQATPAWTLVSRAGGTGATGAKGATGAAGAKGATGVGVAGPAGPAGATGLQGVAGTTGPQGVAGATGTHGATGATGPAGGTGSTGAAGPQGIPGDANAWGFNGNSGSGRFLGTNDGTGLEIKVANTRAMFIVPGSPPNIVGGVTGNGLNANVGGAVIGGGGDPSQNLFNRVTDSFGAIGGGRGNQAGDNAGTATDRTDATVAGGFDNLASGAASTVSGGDLNQATATAATVGGGLENTAAGASAVVGGGDSNQAQGDHATVAGGDSNQATRTHATVGGGNSNTASGIYAVVAGGSLNVASGAYSTVGGGTSSSLNVPNTAGSIGATIAGGLGNEIRAEGVGGAVGGGSDNAVLGQFSVIAGGYSNVAGGMQATVAGGEANSARALYTTVGGGYQNLAAGARSVVPGGANNIADGDDSFAAGSSADARHDHTFVWNGGLIDDAARVDDGVGNFKVAAIGGVSFNTSNDAASGHHFILFDVPGFTDNGQTAINTWTGAKLTAGGTWANSSDVNRKTAFEDIDGNQVLEQVVALPIRTWQYLEEDPSTRHMGPTAQDFRAAFGLGADEKHIATIDEEGVALAAIQGLYRQVEELKGLKQEVADLRREVARLKAARRR